MTPIARIETISPAIGSLQVLKLFKPASQQLEKLCQHLHTTTFQMHTNRDFNIRSPQIDSLLQIL